MTLSPTIRLFVVIGVSTWLAAAPVYARVTGGEPRFPASVSEKVMGELVRVGRVESPGEFAKGADPGPRWGQADLDHQASSMRAVVDALTGVRPPLSVAAAILAIARVESGWNALSKNPGSTACGLFQFVKATWKAYSESAEMCYDPRTNARAGVKHLIGIYDGHVRGRIEPLTLVTTEAERVEWTYRMMYAYHYHGEGSPAAPEGGAIDAQLAAESGVAPLKGFFSILKQAAAPPVAPRVRRAQPIRGKRNRA